MQPKSGGSLLLLPGVLAVWRSEFGRGSGQASQLASPCPVAETMMQNHLHQRLQLLGFSFAAAFAGFPCDLTLNLTLVHQLTYVTLIVGL